jgi:hypothetical protein
VSGRKHLFLIGNSPFGVSNPYVKDESDGRVYVFTGSTLSELEGAQVRLVDRALHSFKPAEFDELTVAVGQKKRDFTQPTAEPNQPSKLLSKKSGKAEELAKNWHDKLWRQLVSDVLGKGENPAGGVPTVAVRIDYREKGKTVGFIEVGRVTQAAPANTSAPPASEIYARTEHTAGWVKMGQNTEDLLKEADKVVAE